MSESAKCATCGRVDHTIRVDLPKGYVLECERCRAGSPGKPMKAVRHCSMCREPIIVMGLSGGVRLTCPKCAKKDPKLVEVEAVVRDRDKLREKVNDLMHNRTTAEAELEDIRSKLDAMVQARAGSIQQENVELKAQLAEKEETSLAARVQAKMRLKYGESEKQKLRDFLEWVRVSAEWTKSLDVEALVDDYCKE